MIVVREPVHEARTTPIAKIARGRVHYPA